MKTTFIMGTVGLILGALPPLLGAQGDDETQPATHVNGANVDWKTTDELEVIRWKTLLGSDRIPQEDVRSGVFQLAPRATYPGHLHPSPELYYVVSGKAEWTVGEETFVAHPGTAIYTPPNTLHRMVNLSDDVLTAVWAWWAPGGDRSVFDGGYVMVEPLPRQPPEARFPENQ